MFLQLQNRMISICHSDYTMYARISFYNIILTKILIESDDSNQSKIAPCTFFFFLFLLAMQFPPLNSLFPLIRFQLLQSWESRKGKNLSKRYHLKLCNTFQEPARHSNSLCICKTLQKITDQFQSLVSLAPELKIRTWHIRNFHLKFKMPVYIEV